MKALQNEDFDYAKTVCHRLVSWGGGEARENDRFNLAISMLNSGESETGVQLIDELAPNNSAGYPPAHRFKAVLLGGRLMQNQDKSVLGLLQFHLENSNDKSSEQIQAIYGIYYLESNQPEKAIAYLKSAAKKNPVHYLQLASIYQKQNDSGNMTQMLRDAEREYKKILNNKPTAHDIRIQLATVLTSLERNQEAEAILLQGQLLKNDNTINRALADFAIMLHDETDDLDEKLALIQKSLAYDINYIGSYQRLIEQFRWSVQDDPLRAKKLEGFLLQNIATGKSTALAHFAASSLFSIKGDDDRAKFHIERAFKLDPRFGIIANNLAWMLAHDQEKPDLVRAHDLAKEVIDRFPENNRFRDTFGTILLLEKNYSDACTQFEIILDQGGESEKTHQKLAAIYSALGNDELSKMHEKLAKTTIKTENP